MLLCAVSFLVVAQSSSEVQEGLMNNPVYSFAVSGLLKVLAILLNQKPQKCIMNSNICGCINMCKNLHLLCCTKLTAIFVGTKCDGPSFLLCRSHSSFNFASSVASMLRILALKCKHKLLKWYYWERSILFNFSSKTLWQDQNTGCKKVLIFIWREILEDCNF